MDGAAFHSLPKPQRLSHAHGFAAAWARLRGMCPAEREAQLEQPSDHHPSWLEEPPGVDPAHPQQLTKTPKTTPTWLPIDRLWGRASPRHTQGNPFPCRLGGQIFGAHVLIPPSLLTPTPRPAWRQGTGHTWGPRGLGSTRSRGLISINKANRLKPGPPLALPPSLHLGLTPPVCAAWWRGLAVGEKMADRPCPPT